ncbi:MAG: 30S ribosomal protein S16 [bacterium]
MAIVIRLKRMGKNKSAFYRVVAADEKRSAKSGPYIEDLGHYNPESNPAGLVIDEAKALKWLKNGARPTVTVKSIFKKLGIMDKAKASVK